MTTSLDERLTELEVRISFLDDTVTALNDVVARHARQLHDLREAIVALQGDLQAVRGSLMATQDEPPPPHY